MKIRTGLCISPLLLLLLSCRGIPSAGDGQVATQPGQGLRLDLALAADRGRISLRVEGAWLDPQFSGPPAPALAPDTGSYRYQLRDAATGRVLWQLGFATLLDEWLTLPGNGERSTSYPCTIRVPRPAAAALVVVEKRFPGNEWRELGRWRYDPATPPQPAPAMPAAWRRELRISGPPPAALDLLVIGDGYRREEMDRFRQQATRALAWLRGDLARNVSVRLVAPYAESSGPGPRSPLGCCFGSMGMPRYLLPTRQETIEAIRSRVPADLVLVVVNTDRYGGGGVHNRFAVTSGGHLATPLICAHEAGHLVADLADEYVGTVSYSAPRERDEPRHPNITRCTDRAGLKWRDLLTPGIPLPTPDTKAHNEATGLFEGAGYQPKGIFRPCRTCIMRSLKAGRFCPVCSRALRRTIDFWAGR